MNLDDIFNSKLSLINKLNILKENDFETFSLEISIENHNMIFIGNKSFNNFNYNNFISNTEINLNGFDILNLHHFELKSKIIKLSDCLIKITALKHIDNKRIEFRIYENNLELDNFLVLIYIDNYTLVSDSSKSFKNLRTEISYKQTEGVVHRKFIYKDNFFYKPKEALEFLDYYLENLIFT